MPDPKQPEDHKPAKSAAPFKFKAGGKSYSLPAVAQGQKHLSGRDLRDATLGGDIGQLGYMFKTLEASGATDAAIAAIYDMPQDEALEVLQAWGEHGDGDGASLGESSGSSA